MPIGEDLPCASIFPALSGVGTVLPEGGFESRTSKPDFPAAGVVEEKVHWESFGAAPRSIADAVRSLGEGIAKPTEETLKPSEAEVFSKPVEVVAKPNVVVAKPNEVVVKQCVDFVTQSEVVAKPNEVLAQPSEVVAKPNAPKQGEGLVNVREENGRSYDRIAKPTKETLKPSEGFAKPNKDLVRSYAQVGKLEDGIAKLNENDAPVKASEAEVYSKPGDVVAKPNEVVAKQSVDFVKQSEVVAKPKEVLAQPSEDVVKPNAPKQGEVVAKPNEVLAQPSEGAGVRVFAIDGLPQMPAAGIQLSALENQVAKPNLEFLNRQFVSAANAVAESIAVSPASGSSNEREIRIQLKADVLDGSSIKIETNGSELKITVVPASRVAEEMLLKNSELFQAQLAERVANWRINVGVAALSARVSHKLEEET